MRHSFRLLAVGGTGMINARTLVFLAFVVVASNGAIPQRHGVAAPTEQQRPAERHFLHDIKEKISNFFKHDSESNDAQPATEKNPVEQANNEKQGVRENERMIRRPYNGQSLQEQKLQAYNQAKILDAVMSIHNTPTLHVTNTKSAELHIPLPTRKPCQSQENLEKTAALLAQLFSKKEIDSLLKDKQKDDVPVEENDVVEESDKEEQTGASQEGDTRDDLAEEPEQEENAVGADQEADNQDDLVEEDENLTSDEPPIEEEPTSIEEELPSEEISEETTDEGAQEVDQNAAEFLGNDEVDEEDDKPDDLLGDAATGSAPTSEDEPKHESVEDGSSSAPTSEEEPKLESVENDTSESDENSVSSEPASDETTESDDTSKSGSASNEGSCEGNESGSHERCGSEEAAGEAGSEGSPKESSPESSECTEDCSGEEASTETSPNESSEESSEESSSESSDESSEELTGYSEEELSHSSSEEGSHEKSDSTGDSTEEDSNCSEDGGCNLEKCGVSEGDADGDKPLCSEESQEITSDEGDGSESVEDSIENVEKEPTEGKDKDETATGETTSTDSPDSDLPECENSEEECQESQEDKNIETSQEPDKKSSEENPAANTVSSQEEPTEGAGSEEPTEPSSYEQNSQEEHSEVPVSEEVPTEEPTEEEPIESSAEQTEEPEVTEDGSAAGTASQLKEDYDDYIQEEQNKCGCKGPAIADYDMAELEPVALPEPQSPCEAKAQKFLMSLRPIHIGRLPPVQRQLGSRRAEQPLSPLSPNFLANLIQNAKVKSPGDIASPMLPTTPPPPVAPPGENRRSLGSRYVEQQYGYPAYDEPTYSPYGRERYATGFWPYQAYRQQYIGNYY